MGGVNRSLAVLAMLPLAYAAAEPESTQDWQAEEAALLKEVAARGITPDKKAAAVAAANEQQDFNGYLPEADEHVLSHSKLFSVSGGDSLRMEMAQGERVCPLPVSMGMTNFLLWFILDVVECCNSLHR